MSDTQIERPVKMENTDDKETSLTKSCAKETEKMNNKKFPLNASTKKGKHENEARFKFGRKRSQSFIAGNGKFFPPYKRRKKDSIIPPTKFLLGGNIRDPLNLNSLQDEEINKAMNAVTPKSSPLPTPHHRKGEIEVIIPPNLRDPLNLISGADDAEYEQQLVSPTKKGRKSRNRKKKRNSSSGGSTKDDSVDNGVSGGAESAVAVEETQDNEKDVVIESAAQIVQTVEDNDAKEPTAASEVSKEKKIRKSLDEPGKDKRNRKMEHTKDKIVSPVIPQPGAWKRPLPYGHRITNPSGAVCKNRPGGNQQKKGGNDARPNFREKDARFQYGNYTRYYGYRNPMHEEDSRLKCFMQRPELFQDKDVLDIGCNIGHVTLMVARDLGARSVVGIDIDRKLVEIARKNVRHYVNCAESPPGDRMMSDCPPNRFFPISMPILYGPVDVPGFTKGESPSVRKKFPHNVSFVQGNYVLESEALLGTEQPQFDVILCLSVTKWIHLNWGDAGLRQAFRRMFAQLRPGGHLILEAQSWDSYKKKKALTETIFRNFKSIEFFPHKFTQYLLSSEVGFSKCEVIDTPVHSSKGFQRPIQLFTKGEHSPCHSVVSTGTTPSHQMASSRSRKPVYASVTTLSEETGEEKTVETEQQKSMEVGKCEQSTDIASSHDLAADSPNTAKVCEHSDVTLGTESFDYDSGVVDSVASQMELSVITEVSKENTVVYQDSVCENADSVHTRSSDNSSNATATSTSSSTSSCSGSSPSCSNSDVERERGKAR
ncbi:7SK snRNA methylphosphate capping enzyme-like [Schistocerca americana]|uniref:7SK snRNA methylphosphate capping enzyme-like n=1 Tax=Schistocerca americana TaxID=7009 RepID=UPI001F4FAEFA|nr:7SK snRNA methylphosphate capping enzyme-like [Schistocerca americana]XP_049959117.1 7SK snRNA methylphosphate capping enzyme-like [Schistocerca serialis cubense]